MRNPFLGAALLALLLPGSLLGQETPEPSAPHVRVRAHVLVLDGEEIRRVGLAHVQVGGGRVALPARTGGIGAGVALRGIPVSAFVELARRKRALRSESELQVLALSGSSASLSSGTLSMSGWGDARAQGPELHVTPTVLSDGRVRLDVRVGLRDEVQTTLGDRIDASPADVRTTVIVRPGEPATVGSARVRTDATDAGLLHWRDRSGTREALVVLTPEIVSH